MGVVFRQSFKGTVLTYLGAVIGFVTQFFIVTKFLDPEVIGLTKVFYEVGALCASFALLGVSASGMRFFPYFKDEKTGNHGFFFYFICIPAIGSVLVCLTYLLCKEPVLQFFGTKSELFARYFHLVVPLIFILTFWLAMEHYSNINMRIAFPKGVREVGLRVFLVADYLLYASGLIGLDGLMIALLASYALCLLLDFAYVGRTSSISLRHDNSFITPELKGRFLRYTAFLVLSAVCGNIMNQLDIFMLSSVKGLYSAGVYTIAFYMANVIDMPSRSITAISTPLAADALKRGDFETANDLYRKVSVHQLMISGFLLLLIWINIDSIFEVLPNGEKFAEGKYVVLFLGLSKLIATTLNFGSILIQFSRYYYWTLFITLLLTVLTIGTNLLFIPLLGISGAALATLITSVISFSYQQFLVQRKVHGNPFSKGTLKVLALLLCLYGLNLLIPGLGHISVWLDIAVRTSVIGAAGITAIYLLRISAEFNATVDKYLRKHQENE